MELNPNKSRRIWVCLKIRLSSKSTGLLSFPHKHFHVWIIFRHIQLEVPDKWLAFSESWSNPPLSGPNPHGFGPETQGAPTFDVSVGHNFLGDPPILSASCNGSRGQRSRPQASHTPRHVPCSCSRLRPPKATKLQRTQTWQ